MTHRSSQADAPRDEPRRAIVAVDTGGTFTDLVWWERGRARVAKVPSTPDDPGRALLEGLRRLVAEAGDGARVDQVLHGSTVATNAVLERRGARVALVTNAGFEDLLAIGRQRRPELYALRVDDSGGLVGRGDGLGVPGRIGPDGGELEPLDDDGVAALIERLAAREGVESVAICLLHSYANDRHEARLSAALVEALPDLDVSVSSQLLPRFREVERASTTVLNAYVQPVMRRYLTRLGAALDESFGAGLLIVQSDGGMVDADEAARRPVHTLLSGPAGGVVGARQAGGSAGFERVIAFDMGGTSTDVSLIDGEPTLTSESEIGGLPLAVTTIAIHTVGAGGGSIAWIDAGGALKVGPRSAGADPGPACYGRGDDPTVTDAHVVLGRLTVDAFLGGEMRLDPEAAERVVGRLGQRLGLGLEEAARGIIDVANAHMVRAIKVISLERGHDPRDFCLVGFGGAGGLHAAELAAALGLTRVLLPANPGLLSAVGMLRADLTRELTRTVLETLSPADPPPRDRVEAVGAPLESEARAFFDAHGVTEADRSLEWLVDCRYRGQSFELAVPAAPGDDFVRAFHERHEWRYGYRLDRPVEWVALRLRARGRRWHHGAPSWETRRPPERLAGGVDASGPAGRWPVVHRSQLAPGDQLRGPVVVPEYSSTTWVPAGWRLTVLADRALLLTTEAV